MIDPKLNELSDNSGRNTREAGTTQTALSSDTAGAKPRQGLSINDTIAADANLSVGSRGVDVSGARSGAGAGDGGTYLSPAAGESPAAQIRPGPSGSGTTPLSTGAVSETDRMHDSSTAVSPDADTLDRDEVATHAYNIWHEQGRPEGAHEDHWAQAERELRERRARQKVNSASA